MPDFYRVKRPDVLAALEEYDEVGRDLFLMRHGFRPAREYVLRHDGRGYDSKAILGVAHGKATGRVAMWDEFTGGKDGAAKWLRKLGFQVDHVDESSLDDPPATGSWREASEVGGENARLAWTAAARDVLLDTAKCYHAVITYKELSGLVQFADGNPDLATDALLDRRRPRPRREAERLPRGTHPHRPLRQCLRKRGRRLRGSCPRQYWGITRGFR